MSKDISASLLTKLGGNYTPIYLFEFQKLNDEWQRFTNLDIDFTPRDTVDTYEGLKVTFDSSKVPTSLTHFPVKIIINTSSPSVPSGFFEGHAGSGDYEYLYAITGSATQLYIDVERWEPENGLAVIWVSGPSFILSSLTDTEVNLYWDVDTNTQIGLTGESNCQNVWHGSYEGVYHFNQDPTTGYVLDATINNRNGELYGSMALGDLIELPSAGYGYDFNGVNQGACFGDVFDSTIAYDYSVATFEIAFNMDAFGTTSQTLYSKYNSGKGFRIRIYAEEQSGLGTPGDSWTGSYALDGAGNTWSAAYGEVDGTGYYVTVSQTAGEGAHYSTDGENWTNSNWATSIGARGIAFDSSRERFVVVGHYTSSYVQYSDNGGVTWNNGGTVTGSPSLQDIDYNPNSDRLVAVAYYTAKKFSYWSDDGGATWSASSDTSVNMRGVCYSSDLDLWVAVGANSAAYWSDDDGETWTAGTGEPAAKTFYSVCWSPTLGLFVACGSAISGTNNVMYSSDGKAWTDGSITNGTYYRAADCNGRIVVCGVAAVAYSDDGQTFTDATPTTPGTPWRGLAFNGSDTVVAGGNDYSMKSVDASAASTYVPKLQTIFTDQSETMSRTWTSSITPSADTDYHLVVKYDGSKDWDRVKMFINGVEDTSSTLTSAGSAAAIGVSDFHAGVAAEYDDIGTMIGSHYNGRIDELKIRRFASSDDYATTQYKNWIGDLYTISSETVSGSGFTNSTSASGTFQSRNFNIDELNYSEGKIMQDCNISIDNRDSAMTALFTEDSLRDQPARVYYGLIDTSNPGYLEELILLFDGYIDSWKIDEEKFKLNIGSLFERWNRKAFTLQTTSCPYKKFKGTYCKYAGAGSSCDRSYTQCASYSNTANFGGERWLNSIEGKKIWFGPVPSNVKE